MVLVILLMFALFGAMFFMTFYLENVHGLDPIQAGVHLLPMTAMLIVGSPIAGTLINKIGPRLPITAGMAMAAVAMFGLSRLGAASSPNDTIIWFVLLGLGLAPVMVGATNVIVGNAPAELAGVAGGLQSTAMQLGGAFGTAVLGAIMSARIDSLLPASWHAAHLPPLTAARLRPGQKRGLGRGGAGDPQHPGAGGRRDHPDQPRHVHRRDAQRLPGRRRRRTRRSRHRPDHQERHRHRRSARRHLTPAQPATSPVHNPESGRKNVMSALPTRTPVTPARPQPTPPAAPRPGRKNVMSALLNRKPVLWFLFLFNAAVAIAAGAAGSHLHLHGHTLHGSQQVTTAAGMGIVALGAGAALYLRRAKRA